MDNWLKRFDYLELENEVPKSEGQGWILTKRRFMAEYEMESLFLAISDQIIPSLLASRPKDVEFDLVCHFCGHDNQMTVTRCQTCQKSLEKQLTPEEIPISETLACDACQSLNDAQKMNCWVCGKNLPGKSPSSEQECTNQIMIDSVQGKYQSSDKQLPYEVTVLLKKIRKQGLSSELASKWIRWKNRSLMKKQAIEDRSRQFGKEIMNLASDNRGYLIVIVVLLLLYAITRL